MTLIKKVNKTEITRFVEL